MRNTESLLWIEVDREQTGGGELVTEKAEVADGWLVRLTAYRIEEKCSTRFGEHDYSEEYHLLSASITFVPKVSALVKAQAALKVFDDRKK